MSDNICVRPGRLANFGEHADCNFVVITSPRFSERIDIDAAGSSYSRHELMVAGTAEEAHDLIAQRIPERSHILVILPDVYFRSPEPQFLTHRKLGVLACYSTPTSVVEVNHFLRQAENTRPDSQQRYAEFFFGAGEAAEYLEFRNDSFGTSAIFRHLDDDLMWHEQVGPLEWGEQQLLPSGEISVLPVSVFGQDIERQLDVSGQIALAGAAIVHAGSVSFQRADQARIYEALSTLAHGAVVLDVDKGKIKAIEAIGSAASEAARYLRMLCEIDSRYASLVEIGFGCNFTHTMLASNSAMNEVYGAPTGAIHLGFGLLPFTQYHIDIICPATRVLSSAGRDILGPRAKLPFLSS